MAKPRTLGRYELIDRLAVGGMAEIYIATYRSIQGFKKDYVLKLIHPKNSGDEEFMRMLVDEAKLTAQLHHVNIAQVIDLGIDDDQYFIVMEYVKGRDLYQVLNEAYDRNVPIPLDVCAYIAREMAAGLHYAHTKIDEDTKRPLNLVHRDISPQNVLVSWDGEVKIVDFGVAKAALAARPETQAGVIKGKFRYMSPEQAWGEKLDGRSDLFSAGLCLYEMATATMAYDDEPDMRKMLVKMREAKFTPPSSIRPEISAELESIIFKALKRRRHERFPSAEAFEGALNAYLHRENPNFTRARVKEFLARVYPHDYPYDPPKPIAPTGDPVTQPVSKEKPSHTRPIDRNEARAIAGGKPQPHQLPQPRNAPKPRNAPQPAPQPTAPTLDTGDHTIRQSIVNGKVKAPAGADSSLEGDFADEATELWSQPMSDDAAATDELDMHTADMSSARLQRLIAENEKDTEEHTRRPRENPHAKVPTAWKPSENPHIGNAPHATVSPGMQSPHQHMPLTSSTGGEPASRPSEGLVAELRAMVEDENTRKILIPAALGLGLAFVLMVIFVAMVF